MTATMSDLHAVYSTDLREKEVTRDQQKTPKMQRRTPPGMRLFARQVAEVSARLADEFKWKGVHHRFALDRMLAPRKVPQRPRPKMKRRSSGRAPSACRARRTPPF